MESKNDFKVVDRRASSGASDSPQSEAKKDGEGFVMKDKNPPAPSQIDFATFVFSLATGALIHMGIAPDPQTQKTQKNLELATQNIELLALLKEKTVGNLSKEETEVLDSLLTEVRLRFVEASKK